MGQGTRSGYQNSETDTKIYCTVWALVTYTDNKVLDICILISAHSDICNSRKNNMLTPCDDD